MKTCSKCREIKEFICFDKNKSRPDEHSCYCKECSSKRRKEIKNDDILLMKKAIRSSILIENKILKPQGKKICSKCKQIHSLDNFNGTYCYPCKREIEKDIRSSEIGKKRKYESDKKSYQKYKKERAETSKKYREKNKEVISIKKREWYEKNIEYKKEYDKKYREKRKEIDKEKKREYMSEYRLKNKLEKQNNT